MVVSTLKIAVNPTVALLYSECKTECSFNAKSDSDFLLFLLSSAIRISTLVKDFSPVLLPSTLTVQTNNERSEAKSAAEKSKPDKEALLAAEEERKLSSEYEDVLEHIEQTSDLETLQKYIDTVEESLNNNVISESPPEDQTKAVTVKVEDIIQDTALFHERTNSENLKPDQNGAQFNCTMCSIKFKTQEQFSVHIKSGNCVSEKKPDESPVSVLRNGIPASRITCSLCNCAFETQGGLSRHIRSGSCLQSKAIKQLLNKDDILDCAASKKRSLDTVLSEELQSLNKYHKPELSLNRHINSELKDCVDKALLAINNSDKGDKAFLCSNCAYTFSTKAALAQHERSQRCEANKLRGIVDASAQQSAYVCHLCNSSLASKSGLQKHLKRGQCRLYRCASCDQTYKYIHDLKTHLKNHHGGENLMSAASINQSLLRMGVPSMTGSSHMNLSYDQFKFSPKGVGCVYCGVCEFQAACQKSLNNHTRIHIRQLKAINADTKCMLCTYISEDEKELLEHYKTQHADFISAKSETPEFKLVELMLRHLKRNSLKKTIKEEDQVQTVNGLVSSEPLQSGTAPLPPTVSSPAVIKTKSLNDNSLKLISAQLKSIDLLQKRLDELDKNSDSENKPQTNQLVNTQTNQLVNIAPRPAPDHYVNILPAPAPSTQYPAPASGSETEQLVYIAPRPPTEQVLSAISATKTESVVYVAPEITSESEHELVDIMAPPDHVISTLYQTLQ